MIDKGFGVAASCAVLGSFALAACGGVGVQGARPWSGADAPSVEAQASPLAEYELSQCSDVLGQALPVTPERLTLYRAGDAIQLASESEGLTPLVLENRLHGDEGNTFQAIVNGQLLEIQLPTEKRSGHWLLASHWEEWQQQRGFGARPIRVVERCEVAAAPAALTAQNPAQPAQNPPFGLAKAPQAGYGVGPVHEREQQRQ